MFSVTEKKQIADGIEKQLMGLHHPEMPTEKPSFKLHVDGAESWSWADIEPNWKYEESPSQPNPWNEVARKMTVPEAMDALKQAMVEDPDYAHGWHCNIAMACFDSMDTGVGHEDCMVTANNAASRFMKLCFDVVTTQ